MIALIYTRVSTEDQVREGYSLAEQLEACRKRAKEIGATEIVECVEEGVTGEVLNRPALTRARELVRAGGIGAFVCKDPDRFSRKLYYQLMVTEEIERARIRIEFIDFLWQDTPEGKMFYSMRGAIAEYEKEKIKQRTAGGKLQKAKQGDLPHWPGTYGYTYTRRDGKRAGFVSINEDQADTVRQIFRWFVSEDLGYHAIADRLNASGLSGPKGGAWARPTVKRIIACPTYKGDMIVNRHDTAGVKYNKYKSPQERVHRKMRPKDEWIKLQVPAIVDEIIWAAAQKKAGDIRRTHANKSTVPYLLSGIARCAACGATMHGNLVTWRDGRKIPYYVCTAKSPGLRDQPKCELPFIRRDEIDDQVWDSVKAWLSNPQYLAQTMQKQNRVQDHRAEITRLEKRLAETVKERTRLIDVLQKGLAPEGEIDSRLADVKRRHDQLLARLEELRGDQAAAPTAEETTAAIQHLADDLGDQLDSLSDERKREVIRLLVDRVLIGQDSLQITAKVPSCLV